MRGRIDYEYTPHHFDQLSGVGISRPELPPGVLKQQRHLVTSRRYTSPTRMAAHTGMLTGAWQEKSLKPLKPESAEGPGSGIGGLLRL